MEKLCALCFQISVNIWLRGSHYFTELSLSIGVCGSELTRFANYLSNRLQRVKLTGVTSSWTSVQRGIPQGSALGPLLFLVYVKEMPSMANYYSCWWHHADLFWFWFLVMVQLSHDLSLVYNWISASSLQLNIKKSSVMWCTPRPSNNMSCPSIVVNNTQLKEVDNHKYLGIFLIRSYLGTIE